MSEAKKRYSCSVCEYSSNSKYNRDRHEKQKHTKSPQARAYEPSTTPEPSSSEHSVDDILRDLALDRTARGGDLPAPPTPPAPRRKQKPAPPPEESEEEEELDISDYIDERIKQAMSGSTSQPSSGGQVVRSSMTGTVGNVAFGMALCYLMMSNYSIIKAMATSAIVGQKKTLSPEALEALRARPPPMPYPLSQETQLPTSTPPVSSSVAVASSTC
jgi:hypothetical protein